jgi:heptaprenyl diphosphate synthase
VTPRASLGTFLSRNVTPRTLFVAGALLFPAFLFQRDLGLRCFQVVLFFLLAGLSGRRLRIVQNLILAAGVIAFSLAARNGLVLAAPLGVPITDVSLRGGVARATALVGMIALSQFSVRPDLRLPGTVGGLIARTLFYFEKIMAEGRKIRRSSVLQDIDEVLLSIYSRPDAVPDGKPAGSDVPTAASTPAGLAVLGAIVAANWAALAYTVLRPGLLWAL